MQVDITWEVAGLTVLFAFCALGATVLLTRLYGLRSFAKFAGFDFAATIAVGSLLAATAAGSVPLVRGLVALAALFAAQRVFLFARNHGLGGLIDNTPLLLMRGEEVLWDNLASGGVTHDDLLGKLREANVIDVRQVRAVVLEATGDIAVLHGEIDGHPLDRELLSDVEGRDGATDPSSWRDGPGLGSPD